MENQNNESALNSGEKGATQYSEELQKEIKRVEDRINNDYLSPSFNKEFSFDNPKTMSTEYVGVWNVLDTSSCCWSRVSSIPDLSEKNLV